MSIRRLKTVLRTAAFALWLATLSLVGWSVWEPVDVAIPEDHQPNAQKRLVKDKENGPSRPALSQFKPLWKKRLRLPLYDPPPPKPKVVKVKPPPPLKTKLLGTMIEPGNSRAMLSTPRGAVELKGVGDVIDTETPPAKVVTIEPNRVVVRRNDRLITLEIKGR